MHILNADMQRQRLALHLSDITLNLPLALAPAHNITGLNINHLRTDIRVGEIN